VRALRRLLPRGEVAREGAPLLLERLGIPHRLLELFADVLLVGLGALELGFHPFDFGGAVSVVSGLNVALVDATAIDGSLDGGKWIYPTNSGGVSR